MTHAPLGSLNSVGGMEQDQELQHCLVKQVYLEYMNLCFICDLLISPAYLHLSPQHNLSCGVVVIYSWYTCSELVIHLLQPTTHNPNLTSFCFAAKQQKWYLGLTAQISRSTFAAGGLPPAAQKEYAALHHLWCSIFPQLVVVHHKLWCFHCEFQCSWKLHWCEICRWKLQISQG